MAIIKCKMCGGDIELAADKTFGTCEFCGSTMTFPKVDDEQRAAAFNRGNHFRRTGEFDKALAVYERIVTENDADAEAHWCCALCRFGIEYVEDPATYEWIPTCHRASFDSFLEDVDYLAALEHSDGVTKRQYQKDAARIAEVQRGILATSQREEPFDVFICYKETDENGNRTTDSQDAQELYYRLTDAGYRVFFSRITLEDKGGAEYEPYIFAALNSAKVMIVVGSKAEYFNAVWVKNEWSRFLSLMKKDRNRLLLPCYRNMDPYDLPEQLSVLQSYDLARIGVVQDLLHGIKKVLDADKKPENTHETVMVQQVAGANVSALLDRGNMALEDGDWAKADEFFEEVLNNDSKNAQAYLGKALVQEKCQTIEAFVQKRKELSQNVHGKTLKITPNLDHVDEMVRKFSLPHFVEESKIRELYSYGRSYHSDAEERRQQYRNEEKYWAEHKQLSRAEKFAEGAVAENLAAKKKAFFADLFDQVTQAEAAEAAAVADVKDRYAAHLKAADEKAEQLYEKALKAREEFYQDQCDYMERSVTADDFERVVKSFKKIQNYNDSRQRIDACLKKIEEIKEEERRIASEKEAEERRIAAEKAAREKRLAAEKAAEEMRRKEKNKKIRIVIAIAAVIVIAAVLVVTQVVIPNNKYKNAEALLAAGQYDEAIAAFEALGDFNHSASRELDARYQKAESLLNNGNIAEAAMLFGSLGDYPDARQQSLALWDTFAVRDTISAGGSHTVGLKADGTVVAVGCNSNGQCDVGDWTDVVAISAGDDHTVGLKADGTVVAVGRSYDGQCDVGDWSDIVAISAGDDHTVGLKADGTVVAVGDNDYSLDDVGGWSDIVAISGGFHATVGLKSDGTVVAVGDNYYSLDNVGSWSDIVAVHSGTITVGLKSDGTAVAVGDLTHGRCNVGDWSDIIAVCGGGATVGLKSDGTVVAIGHNGSEHGDVGDWSDIVSISAVSYHTVGLKADGTVIATGGNGYGQCDVSDWTDIRLPN